MVFGEIFYDGLKNCYTIEYGFEEVNSGSVLLLDHLVFKTLEDLQNHEKRYAAITERLIVEFDLCRPSDKELIIMPQRKLNFNKARSVFKVFLVKYILRDYF